MTDTPTEHRCHLCKVPLDKTNAHCEHPSCPWCQTCVHKRHQEAKP